jgi:putative phosphoserine phosphatase/1-acylglycerol-3-phosphate O-acyltransferase
MENPRLIIFDIDGTLLPGTSTERLFSRYLRRNRIAGYSHLFNFILKGLALAPKGVAYIISANKGYLKGFSPDYMEKIGSAFFNNEIEKRISKKGFVRLTEHKMRGHKVVLLSGMPEFLLRNYSRLFKVDEYYGSVLETDNGIFTGKTVGVFPIIRGKPEVVESILKKYDLDWRHVTAYADHFHDRYLLKKVGRPVAVNPDDKLKALAEENGWQIEYFDDTSL